MKRLPGTMTVRRQSSAPLPLQVLHAEMMCNNELSPFMGRSTLSFVATLRKVRHGHHDPRVMSFPRVILPSEWFVLGS